jgi:hypothetical protein
MIFSVGINPDIETYKVNMICVKQKMNLQGLKLSFKSLTNDVQQTFFTGPPFGF